MTYKQNQDRGIHGTFRYIFQDFVPNTSGSHDISRTLLRVMINTNYHKPSPIIKKTMMYS